MASATLLRGSPRYTDIGFAARRVAQAIRLNAIRRMQENRPRVMRLGVWVLSGALAMLVGAAQADAGDARILEARDAHERLDTQKLASLARSSSEHVLEPYVRYWLLSARIARINEDVSNDSVQSFLRDNEGSLIAERLRADWLKRLARQSDWALFDEQIGLLAQPDLELRCITLQRKGDSAALEPQWLTLTDTPPACAAMLRELALRGSLSIDDLWWRFRRLVEASRQGAARDVLEWIAEREPRDAPDIQSLSSAFGSPTRFLATSSARNTASRARREVIMAAVVRLSRSGLDDAVRRWQSLQNNGFSERERAYVWGQLGFVAAQQHLAEAPVWLSRAQDLPMNEEQRAWHARALLRSGDWRNLALVIENMAERQREQPEWVYWLGRALRQMKREKEAVALFERRAGEADFYGILSAEALGRRFIWPTAALPATLAELEAAKGSLDLQRGLALLRLGLRLEGLREWSWGLRNADDRRLLAASEWARRESVYDRAINAAERTKSEHDFALRYPVPYYETLAGGAQRFGLDPAWVYGLVRQESRFQVDARSSVGAGGLMQVMPATGRWIARKIGAAGYSNSWLIDMERNVQLGSAYLRDVHDNLDRSMVLASAAYNAGPSRARKWRGTRALEGAIYAETIPFNETRDYVKRVLANSVIYANLFDSPHTSLTARLGIIQSTSSAPPAPEDEGP